VKILVHSLFFYPDHSGIAKYSTDFAFYAAEKGHSVEVVAGYPFYPQWKKRKEDKRKLFSTDIKNNVKILRGYLYVPNKLSTVKRLIQEFTFLLSSFIGYCRATKPDVIVVFTTPVSLGFLASIFKWWYKSKLVINVQDFQLEAAASLGMIKGSLFFDVLAKIENRGYKSSNYVSSISDSMIGLLEHKKKLDKAKILYWPNWIDLNEVKVDTLKRGVFRTKNNVTKNSFIVAYAGNIGLKQGLEIFIDLAKRFETNSNIVFLMIGEGAGLPLIKQYAKEQQVKNVTFAPFLNEQGYMEFLNDIDVFFMSQKKTAFDVYFPSKLLGLMAAGKTLLLSADTESELYKTVKKNEIGLVSEYGDTDEIVKQLNLAYTDESFTHSLNKRAVTYVTQFHRDNVLDKVLSKLSAL
jgi:colanic acid biosynthesis glycosyl transferase WcaI